MLQRLRAVVWCVCALFALPACEAAPESSSDVGARADAFVADGATAVDAAHLDGGGSSVDASVDAPGNDASSSDASTPTVDVGMDDLASLPPDTGGTHTPHPIGTTTAAFGYYVYLPGGYEESTASYPLIVFLHGMGERGDGDAQLARVLNLGIPRLIERGMWDPSHPAIVASPQYPSPDGMGNENNWGEGDPSAVRGFIEHMLATYRVNEHRIYLTGLSHGGNGVFDYITQQDDATSYLAAAVPIAAWGPSGGFARANDTPIWVFVGSADTNNFNHSRMFVIGYNAQVPPPAFPARFSVYAGAGHDVWTRTYDLSGMGAADPAYDPYDVAIYDWMFSHRRE